MNVNTPINSYFAAANGYTGFRSYFKSVFDSNELKKMYIIKGGPGTGKSTLMKSISEYYADKAIVTRIYCSSDHNSLDGVLIEKDGLRVGIADGTAPHVIDPAYPGAVEEIINLADGFDYDSLAAERDQIILLSKAKKDSYDKAYSFLRAAGESHRILTDILLSNKTYIEAEWLDSELAKETDTTKHSHIRSDYLLGSFSKDGYKMMRNEINKELILIPGDGVSEYLITDQIKKKLDYEDKIVRIYPSAFSDEYTDAIETETCLFSINHNEINKENCPLYIDDEEYIRIKKIYDRLLSESRIYFSKASEYHFKLESIYSSNISFDNNKYKYESIIHTLNTLFDK